MCHYRSNFTPAILQSKHLTCRYKAKCHTDILASDLTDAHTHLLLERHAVLLLKPFALADQVALLCEDGGGGGHFVGDAALAAAAAAPHRPHLLLIAANAVCTVRETSLSLILVHIL